MKADGVICLGAEKSAPEVSPDEPPQAASVSATSASSTVQTMRAPGRALCVKETLSPLSIDAYASWIAAILGPMAKGALRNVI